MQVQGYLSLLGRSPSPARSPLCTRAASVEFLRERDSAREGEETTCFETSFAQGGVKERRNAPAYTRARFLSLPRRYTYTHDIIVLYAVALRFFRPVCISRQYFHHSPMLNQRTLNYI